MYRLIFSKTQALKKDIKHLKKNQQTAHSIKMKLDNFSQHPFGKEFDINLLRPKSNERYRIRMGAWRVIYSIDTGNKIIIIHRIAPRKNIYL